MIVPLVFGIAGFAILVGLGLWQLQRLEWKRGVIATIEARLAEPPGAVPPAPTEAADEYRRVAASGVIGSGEIHVYTATPSGGVGYRVIAPFTLEDGRAILLDRGFAPIAEKDGARPTGPARVEGALLWPDDGSGGPPDLDRNVWIARDPAAMAATLGTEPVLLVVERSAPPDGLLPLPVTVDIPNRHLEYVVTWFGLAAVWAGMTAYLLWRIRHRTD